MENLDASVVILKKLCDEWKIHAEKHSVVDPLKTTLRSLIVKVRLCFNLHWGNHFGCSLSSF